MPGAPRGESGSTGAGGTAAVAEGGGGGRQGGARPRRGEGAAREQEPARGPGRGRRGNGRGAAAAARHGTASGRRCGRGGAARAWEQARRWRGQGRWHRRQCSARAREGEEERKGAGPLDISELGAKIYGADLGANHSGVEPPGRSLTVSRHLALETLAPFSVPASMTLS